MAKTILYSVCFSDGGDGLRVYNIKQVGLFNDRSAAYVARDGLRAYALKCAKKWPLSDGLGFTYGITEKAGRWCDQVKAIEDAIKKVGVKAFLR